MKRAVLTIIMALALPSLACSVTLPTPPQTTTGPTQTLSISEPLPQGISADKPVEVTLRLGAGELKLNGGADGLAEGTIQYNVPSWKPTVTDQDGRLIIEQGPTQGKLPAWIPGQSNDIVNTWDLKLGNAPMNLTIAAGAYKGQTDLSGLHLRSLAITDGASDSQVTFTAPNPEVMDSLTYETGASAVRLNGLGYANFKTMVFKGGAGDYRLNFDGDLKQSADVQVSTGMSSMRLEFPAATKAKVLVAGGIKNVSTDGTWTTHGDSYETTADSAYTLTVSIDIGMGSLTLVSAK
jgi:hypothetical protein